MNQQMVKDLLISIKETNVEFDVIFTGKTSKKVNGFYKPAERTIFLHNKNFLNDSQLIYTAIHEYAHHIHTEIYGEPLSGRCHTNSFKVIFTKLLLQAENLKIFSLPFFQDKDLAEWTKIFKEKYLKDNTKIMVNFGLELIKVFQLCSEKKINFYDYALIALGLEKSVVDSIMSVAKLSSDIGDSSLDFEKLKVVSKIKDSDKQVKAVEFLKRGEPLVLVKSQDDFNDISNDNYFVSDKQSVSYSKKLIIERDRIVNTIKSLERKLELINSKLDEVDEKI